MLKWATLQYEISLLSSDIKDPGLTIQYTFCMRFHVVLLKQKCIFLYWAGRVYRPTGVKLVFYDNVLITFWVGGFRTI